MPRTVPVQYVVVVGICQTLRIESLEGLLPPDVLCKILGFRSYLSSRLCSRLMACVLAFTRLFLSLRSCRTPLTPPFCHGHFAIRFVRSRCAKVLCVHFVGLDADLRYGPPPSWGLAGSIGMPRILKRLVRLDPRFPVYSHTAWHFPYSFLPSLQTRLPRRRCSRILSPPGRFRSDP